MKEKYKGKVKVPFCVKNETGETYPEIFCEILDFTPHLPQHSPDYYHYCYFGVDDDGNFDFWWDVEDFGKNTTVYTLEKLQAIVDEVNKAEKVLMERGDLFRIKDSLDGGTWYRPNEWYTFHSYFTDNTVVTQEDVDDGMTYGSIYILDKDIDYTSIVKQKTTASCSDDTATLTEDEYVDVGEDETVSNERLKLIGKYVKTPLYPTEWAIVEKYIKDQDIYEVVYSFQDGDGVFVPADCLLEVVDTIPQTTALSIKANISFDVNIKGQTFSLTEKELQDLYVQLCLAEGTPQDWRLGQ